MHGFIKYLLKFFKISSGKSWLPLLVLLASGIGVRILLISEGWPYTNFDEGTIGEMALNIAYRGEHPIYFYGQNYMGALQAYAAAAFFQLFGISLFSLRLGLVLFFAAFLICMCVLTTMLYTRKVALLTLLLLGLGAKFVLYRELQAIGGYPDTLMFGSLALVLATWLTQTSHGEQRGTVRLLVYSCYGLVVGLGLWTDLLILPCIAFSGLLLLLFCWRDIRSLALPCLLLFLALGISPVIWFSLHQGSGQDAISTAFTIFHGGQSSLLKTLPYSVFSTIVVGLPTFTGYYSLCPISNTPFLGDSGFTSFNCVIAQGSWGLGTIALWFCSLFLTLKALYATWKQSSGSGEERRQDIIRSCGRLAILGTAAGSFAVFAISPTAISSPYLNSRYLFCILIGTPALVYPLWSAASAIRRWQGWRKSISVGSWLALISIITVFFSGTLQVVQDIPNDISANSQQYNLVNTLIHIGATHIYSDFFDCDRLIFLSQEKVACNVMDNQMNPTGSRYPAFGEMVAHDPQASYVFPLNAIQIGISEQRFGHNKHYRRLIFDGYVVYRPILH